MAIPLNSERLADLAAYLAKGLAYHHWNVAIPSDNRVIGGMVTPEGAVLFHQLLRMRGKRAVGNLGDGALVYEGLQAFTNAGLSVWRFSIFGGIDMGGDDNVPTLIVSDLWVTSCPPGLRGLLDFDTAA